ncbi:MAG: GIY-YIG nuclease family protein [Alphaproteobacteria bacterium]|uniref:GIY-YIG nuclease family protein n=1 Tax=Marinobacter salarius TaxID=1420917 RepID=UPI0032EEEAE1
MNGVFLTKVWGADFDKLPLLGFATEGARLNFLRESMPGDWVYVVGTKNANTPQHLRGRVLARVQLGRNLYDASAVIDACGYQPAENQLDEHGAYRWPFALPIIYFETIDGQPSLSSLIGEFNDGSHFATYALNVAKQIGLDACSILQNLKTTAVNIPNIPILNKQRAYQNHQAFKARTKGRSGPPPSNGKSLHTHIDGGGFTYLFQFFNGLRPTDNYKIGYAVNWQKRLATLNSGLFQPVTEWRLEMRSFEPFEQAVYAYNMEQHLLRHFAHVTVGGTTEVVNLPDEDRYHRALFTLCEAAKFLQSPPNSAPFENKALDLPSISSPITG